MIKNNQMRIIKTIILVASLLTATILPIFSTFSLAQSTTLTQERLDELKSLLETASQKADDKCFSRVVYLLESSPIDMVTRKPATSSINYLDLKNFTGDNYDHIERTILYTFRDDINRLIWGEDPDKVDSCAALMPDPTCSICQNIKDILHLLTTYAQKPTEDNWNALKEYLTNIGAHIQQAGEEVDKLNFLASGGVGTLTPASETPECAIGYSWGSILDIITQPINIFVGAIITLFTNILKFVLKLLILVFWWVLYGLPKNLGGYTHFAPIQTMWKIFINYADLGIVLGMIFSSIATFFGIEKYSYRKMFPRLIILALIVNFSLVFIGIVVDLSNYLTFIFLPGGDGSSLASFLLSVINNIICAFRSVDEPFSYLAAASLGLIITSIMIFQFIGLIWFVITRYVTILICAATSPLAALGIALDVPPTKGIVELWRNKLTEALVNIVILSIAFYFSLTITSNIANEVVNTKQGIIPLIAYSFFVIALFQLVRIVGKAVGVSQIEAGFNWAKGLVKTAALGAITTTGVFALDKVMNSEKWNKAQKALLENGAKGNLIAGNLGRWMSKTQNSFTAQKYKGVSDTLANESPDVIRTRLAQYEALGDKERATIALGVLAAKGKLTLDDLPLLAKYRNHPNFDKNIGDKLAEKYPDIKRALNNAIFAQDPYLAYQKSMSDLAENIVIKEKSDGLANWRFLFDASKKNSTILDNLVTNIADKILKLDPLKDRIKILRILNNIGYALLSAGYSGQDRKKISSDIINMLKSKLGSGYDKIIENSHLNMLAKI